MQTKGFGELKFFGGSAAVLNAIYGPAQMRERNLPVTLNNIGPVLLGCRAPRFNRIRMRLKPLSEVRSKLTRAETTPI